MEIVQNKIDSYSFSRTERSLFTLIAIIAIGGNISILFLFAMSSPLGGALLMVAIATQLLISVPLIGRTRYISRKVFVSLSVVFLICSISIWGPLLVFLLD